MYALVLWLKSKTSSIISIDDLCPEKEECEETFAKYGDMKRLYKVKIIRKSDDQDYLSYLRVTTDGEILTKGKNITSKIAVSEKKLLVQKEKTSSKNRLEIQDATNSQLLLQQTIFEDLEPGSSTSNDNFDCNINQGRGYINDDSDDNDGAEIPSNTDADKIAKLEKLLEDMKKKIVAKRKADEYTTRNKRNKENDVLTVAEENQEEDPLVTCRQAGNGRVQICEAYNIWIDKADLIFVQRWLTNPKEMTRRLLKLLVGINNLKRMCARGKSKNRPCVPKDIVTCIEYYVNRKCTHRLSPSEFTDVINYLCGTLRAEEAKRNKEIE